ncbi:MAG: hypothetical protein L6R36_007465 [Xanthoria steineri]|nr:MAG: hypothetical protein L6R36_007465 [Xanthoria steineri]
MGGPSDRYTTVIPPPSGTQSNFVNPPNQTAAATALHAICILAVTCCVLVRLYTRKFIIHQIGWDDYCCVLAYAMTIVFSALLIVGNARGLGYHLWDIPMTEFSRALKMLTIAQWINLPLLGVIKFSCLLSYWRIFKPNQKIRWALQASMTLLVCAYVGMFFASLFECWPLATNWEPAISRGHCLKPKGGVPYVSGSINVVSDIVVLVLPIPAIWSLKMDLRRKLRLVAVFSVGTFAVVASIVRLARTPVVFVDRDRTWNLGKIETWAVLEVNVGLICACSLAFPAFLDRYKVPCLAGFRTCTRIFRSPVLLKSHSKSQHAESAIQAGASRYHDHHLIEPDVHSNWTGDSSYAMSDSTVSKTPKTRHHSTQRADLGSEMDLLAFPEAAHRHV